MEFLKLKLYKLGPYNSYRTSDSNSIELTLLKYHLSDISEVYKWKEWALNPAEDFTGGNISRLQKEGDYIFITDSIAEEEYADYACKISIDNYVKILDQWKQFCKNPPNEILITRENDEIKMEATG